MIYRIKDLKCAYNKGETVLEIPELELSAGQIIIVLGKSGSGKSTLLETLALMNNTISEGQVFFSPPSMGDETHELGHIWRSRDPKLLGRIRAQCFNFIFQQTNLMPNFSVFENIYITKMIQGSTEEECKRDTAALLERIGLAGMEANRNVNTLSGGQKQRVAFARAVIANFDVLFGDEPTGNLDEVNANELMQLLQENIHQNNNKRKKTAIVVSHSIDLAVNYADAIVIINQDGKSGSGIIGADAMYCKTTNENGPCWSNGIKRFNNNEFVEELKIVFSNQGALG